jgi:hypothetical protein
MPPGAILEKYLGARVCKLAKKSGIKVDFDLNPVRD